MKPIIMEMSVRIQIGSRIRRLREGEQTIPETLQGFFPPLMHPSLANCSCRALLSRPKERNWLWELHSLELHRAFSCRIKIWLCSHIPSPEATQANGSPHPQKMWRMCWKEYKIWSFPQLLVASLL